MKESVKAYSKTSVNWTKSQSEIMRYLDQQGIQDTRFSNIGWDSANEGGLVMKKDHYAIMIEFYRLTVLEGGISGKVPVRILIPNVPNNDERRRNQMYRLLYWYLKSKFEAVATGLVDFEQEFLPHLMIKDKSGFVGTVWQMLKKPYERMLSSGEADFSQQLLESPKDPNAKPNP